MSTKYTVRQRVKIKMDDIEKVFKSRIKGSESRKMFVKIGMCFISKWE